MLYVEETHVLIVIGLGNPGREYQRTRHNAGFDVVDVISEKTGISLTKSQFHGLIGEGFYRGKKLVLVKPQTFMNLSGQCASEVLSWYKPEPKETLFIYDDIDLPLGKTRMRLSGSAGTHNGMRSVIGLTGRQDLPRLRIGVGKKPEGWDLADWVLSHYTTAEERQIQFDAFLRAGDAALQMLCEGAEAAMRTANEDPAVARKENSGEKA